jgi:isoleucyl-tRNA synthetase
MVGEDFEYVFYKVGEETYILAKALLEELKKRQSLRERWLRRFWAKNWWAWNITHLTGRELGRFILLSL